MTLTEYIDEIKLELTGGLLNLEMPDETIGKFVEKALRELNRYIDTTNFITIPFSRCIDMSPYNPSAVVRVYHASTSGIDDNAGTTSQVDPMEVAQWQLLSAGGNMCGLQRYALNYAAWNTALQIRNTTSTDLNIIYDKNDSKLYINTAYDTPENITIEYIPVYTNVEQVKSDYWIDVLLKMSLALVKIALGRIRTKYKLSNSSWETDGETLLEEGNNELNNLREILNNNAQLVYPVD